MNVDKLKKAIEAVRAESKAAVNEAVDLGRKDNKQFNAIQSLAKIDVLCDKQLARVDEAVERTQPKPAKEDKAKAKPATK